MSDDSPDETRDDDIGQAIRAELSNRVADMPTTTMRWDNVVGRAHRAVAVRRAVAVGVSLVAVIGLVTVALVTSASGPRRGISVVGSETTTSSPHAPVAPGGVPGDALSFREVQWSTPFGRATAPSGATTPAPSSAKPPSSCFGGQLVTPAATQKAANTVVLADRQKSACYLLGPTLLTGRHIATAVAVQNATTASWEVNVHFANDDFVQKVASRYIGRQIAIILDGIVESAPTINAGITGRDVTISGSFDQTAAVALAAGIQPPGAELSARKARQRATVCTNQDLTGPGVGEPLPLPKYRRLTQPTSAWFGQVQLDVPPIDAQPKVSLQELWNGGSTHLGFIDERYPSAIYDVVLADWTSDASFVETFNGTTAPYHHVLAWVVIGTHRPVEAADVSKSLTVPGIPCYFGTSIAAIDATTGKPIAAALDYH